MKMIFSEKNLVIPIICSTFASSIGVVDYEMVKQVA